MKRSDQARRRPLRRYRNMPMDALLALLFETDDDYLPEFRARRPKKEAR